MRLVRKDDGKMSDAEVKCLAEATGVGVSRIREIERKALAKLNGLKANAVQGLLVTFLPVVGEKYALQGKRMLGRRVMVVGASHYCEHFEQVVGCNALCAHFGKYHFAYKGGELFFGKRCERFSHVVLERYRKQIGETDERRWFRTFSKFYNAFFPVSVSHETRIALMDLMVSTEYVQGAEVRGPNGNCREAMGSDRNFEVFRNTISELKPEVIIFWGPRAWYEICKRLDVVDKKADILHIMLDKRKLTLMRVPHPASSKFNRNHFQKQLKSVGIRADKLAQQTNKKEN
ncbi:MAG: hypothetical protein IJJ84_13800 [Kiritimatiellae bacterium]|nr:hypothetical protein [Kiritimatiellia bacterium]